jgi:hypothetical protein
MIEVSRPEFDEITITMQGMTPDVYKDIVTSLIYVLEDTNMPQIKRPAITDLLLAMLPAEEQISVIYTCAKSQSFEHSIK